MRVRKIPLDQGLRGHAGSRAYERKAREEGKAEADRRQQGD